MSYILAATGLQREARIIARPGMKVIACGGHRMLLSRRLRHQIQQERPVALLSVGIAGALAPTLAVGDVVVAYDVEGDKCNLDWTRRILAALRGPEVEADNVLPAVNRARDSCVIGPRRVIGDGIVFSAQHKAALFKGTGGVSVDMESDIVADAAWDYKLPFAVIRVISDTAGQSLPQAARVPLRRDGGVDLPRVLASVVRYPLQIPALVRTGFDANKALAELLRRLDSLSRDRLLGLDLGELGLDVLREHELGRPGLG